MSEAAIGFDMEIIVSVGYRFRGDHRSLENDIERYRVRTPEELDSAVDEVRDRIWHGSLKVINGETASQIVARRSAGKQIGTTPVIQRLHEDPKENR